MGRNYALPMPQQAVKLMFSSLRQVRYRSRGRPRLTTLHRSTTREEDNLPTPQGTDRLGTSCGTCSLTLRLTTYQYSNSPIQYSNCPIPDGNARSLPVSPKLTIWKARY